MPKNLNDVKVESRLDTESCKSQKQESVRTQETPNIMDKHIQTSVIKPIACKLMAHHRKKQSSSTLTEHDCNTEGQPLCLNKSLVSDQKGQSQTDQIVVRRRAANQHDGSMLEQRARREALVPAEDSFKARLMRQRHARRQTDYRQKQSVLMNSIIEDPAEHPQNDGEPGPE